MYYGHCCVVLVLTMGGKRFIYNELWGVGILYTTIATEADQCVHNSFQPVIDLEVIKLT